MARNKVDIVKTLLLMSTILLPKKEMSRRKALPFPTRFSQSVELSHRPRCNQAGVKKRFRGAVRIASYEESFAKGDSHILEILRAKHPPAHPESSPPPFQTLQDPMVIPSSRCL